MPLLGGREYDGLTVILFPLLVPHDGSIPQIVERRRWILAELEIPAIDLLPPLEEALALGETREDTLVDRVHPSRELAERMVAHLAAQGFRP